MPIYQCTGADLTNAFDRAHQLLVNGTIRKEAKRLYTLSGTLAYAVGHNKAVMLIARDLIKQRLDRMTCTEWLIANGVPESEVRGLTGFMNVRVWKQLWLKKLADEMHLDPYKIYTLEYPF